MNVQRLKQEFNKGGWGDPMLHEGGVGVMSVR